MFLSATLIPVCASSSLEFHVMCSAYKLNNQGDNLQPWCTPFLIWYHSVIPCPVLTVASWPAYGFLKRQVRWSCISISLRIFHSLLWSNSQSLRYSQQSTSRCFSRTLLLLQWSNRCWQFDLVPLLFLNLAWISVSSQFTYCWSLAWRILSINLLACEISAIVQ